MTTAAGAAADVTSGLWEQVRDLFRVSAEQPGRPDPNKTTYRYLRAGMVGLVLLLVVSVLLERHRAPDCWQTSLSAYYYTPVRTIFAGGLLAIGFALIVIRGYTPAQDILLNAAGMFAPVVAMVPITGAGSCWSVKPQADPIVEGKPAPWVTAGIDNNIEALLLVGSIGLLAAMILVAVKRPTGGTNGREPLTLGILVGLGAGLLLVGGAALLHWQWGGFDHWAHYIAAYSMFACLGVVVGLDAFIAHRNRGWNGYRGVYGVIAAGMFASVLVIEGIDRTRGWRHATLILELAEIVLFAAYWVVQTIQNWGPNVGPEVSRGPGGGTEHERQQDTARILLPAA